MWKIFCPELDNLIYMECMYRKCDCNDFRLFKVPATGVTA